METCFIDVCEMQSLDGMEYTIPDLPFSGMQSLGVKVTVSIGGFEECSNVTLSKNSSVMF